MSSQRTIPKAKTSAWRQETDHAEGEEVAVISCWKVTVRGMGEGGEGGCWKGLYLRVSGGLEALTFSSYSSPRNTSGAIQYGEPTTAKGSFLTPSLQEGVRTLYSDVSPKQKGMGRAFSPPTENVTGSFTHVWGILWRLGA